MCKEKQVTDLVGTLDTLFSQGVGHINFTTENGVSKVSVDNTFTECELGKNACGTPTLFFENEE